MCASAGVVAVHGCRAKQEHLLPQVVCCCAANALPLDEEHQYLRTFAGALEHDNNLPDLLERQSWRTRTRSSSRMARISFVAAVLPLTCILRGLLNLQVFNYLWRWSRRATRPTRCQRWMGGPMDKDTTNNFCWQGSIPVIDETPGFLSLYAQRCRFCFARTRCVELFLLVFFMLSKYQILVIVIFALFGSL